MPRGLKIAIVWLLEFAAIFALAETISVFFLPPGLIFYHPQQQVEPSARRIYDSQPNQRTFTIDKPYVTNSLGFRDEREVPLAKHGELRILSLGDSIAQGLGVAAEDTYARKLEASLAPRYGAVRVINAAVASYSTWQEVDLLEDKGLRVRPDIVMLSFCWNDLFPRPRLVIPLPVGDSNQYYNATLLRVLRELKRSRVLSFLRERLEIAWFKAFPSFGWTHQQMIYEGRTSPYLEQSYSDVAASLEVFASLARIHHFVPILIILPMPGQVRHPDPAAHMQRRMEAIARRVGIPTVDLLPTLQQTYASTRDVYIQWDNTHLSPRGHQAVAAALERYLLDSQLIKRQGGA